MNEEKANLSSKKKKVMYFIIIVAVVLITLIIGISIYNMPSNRLSRQLNLGNRYLEEQNYEQAIVEFDKAIAIDPMSVDAYLGKAQAYEGLDNIDMAIQMLTDGYERTEDEQIQEALLSAQLGLAHKYLEEQNYEQAVVEFDKAIAIDPMSVAAYLGKAQANEGMGEIDMAIQTMQEGYEQTKDEDIWAKWQYFISVQKIQMIYNMMVSEDYDSAYQEFLNIDLQNGIIYIPKTWGSLTGLGIEINFQIPEIFYGNFIDGKREGNGVLIIVHNNDTKDIFIGNWENGRPNGWGEVTYETLNYINDDIWEKEKMYAQGNLLDGLWNGTVSIVFPPENYFFKNYLPGESVVFSVTFNQGIPEDKKEDVLVSIAPYNLNDYVDSSKVGIIGIIGDYYLNPHEFGDTNGLFYYIHFPDGPYGILPYGSFWPRLYSVSGNFRY